MTSNAAPIATTRFVAMFDILGFKALRAELGTDRLFQRVQRGVLPGIHHTAAGKSKIVQVDGQSVSLPDFSATSLGFRVISDTVIFYTKDDSDEAFFRIVMAAFKLLQWGFSGLQAPYRGAVGYGDFIEGSDGTIIGGAIEDAYIGETSQAWAGVMLTPVCAEFANSRGYVDDLASALAAVAEHATDERARRAAKENARILCEYDVPVQSNPKDGPATYGTLRTLAIDWTVRMYEGAGKAAFPVSDSAHAKVIADNTLKFEAWARARRD